MSLQEEKLMQSYFVNNTTKILSLFKFMLILSSVLLKFLCKGELKNEYDGRVQVLSWPRDQTKRRDIIIHKKYI